MDEVRKVVLVAKTNPEKLRDDTRQIMNVIKTCEEYHVMPRSGGLFDQDNLFVYILQNYMIWSAQRAELDSRKNAAL